MLNVRSILDAMLPKGPIWSPKLGGFLDQFFDGMAENMEQARVFLSELASIRDPENTTVLSDLEKEFGIITNTSISEATRREALKAIVYSQPKIPSEAIIQAALRTAGFDVYVYQNDPAVDPSVYFGQAFAYCGWPTSCCGNSSAQCGYTGSEILVNGDLYTSTPQILVQCGIPSTCCGNATAMCGYFTQSTKTKKEYTIPEFFQRWPKIFWVGGEEVAVDVDTLQSFSGGTPSGVGRLPEDMTINSITEQPDFRYNGKDGAATDLDAWGYGGDLGISSDVIIDGDCEEVGTGAWAAISGSVLTKDTTDPYEGVQCLRITHNGVNNASAQQLNILNIGTQYKATGHARGDGSTGVPRLKDSSGQNLWAGTNSTSWQSFNVTFIANGTHIWLYSNLSLIGDFVQWDNIIVKNLDATAPTLNDGSPGLGTNDDSVKTNDGYYYEGTASDGNITTEDIVFRYIGTFDPSANAEIASHYQGLNQGWKIYTNGGAASFTMYDSGGSVSVTSAVLSPGAYHNLALYVDRSGSAQWYDNGVVSGSAVVVSGVSGSLSGAAHLKLGQFADQRILYAAMWIRDAWLDTHLQGDLESQMHTLLTGIYPQINDGPGTPTVATRNDVGYLRKLESNGKIKIYPVGAHWLRVEKYKDENLDTYIGYLAEDAATNLLTENNDFSAWTKSDAGDVVTDDNTDGPDGTTSAADFVPDSTNGEHSLALAFTAGAGDNVLSAYIRPGTATIVKLEITDSGASTIGAYFDLSTLTVGTELSGSTGYISQIYEGDFYRLEMTGSCASGAATAKIYLCDADATDTFSGGDGASVGAYLSKAQAEAGIRATSPIDTDGGTDSRVADVLRYDGTGNLPANSGVIEFYLVKPDKLPAANEYIVSLNDGGSTNDSIEIFVNTSGNLVVSITEASVLQATLVGEIVTDNQGRLCRLEYSAASVTLKIDGVIHQAESNVLIPDDLDRIDVGTDSTGGSQLNGMISDFKILSDQAATKITAATVPASREYEFKRIILNKKPLASWAGLIVKWV
jgi:hypothetical protein